MPPVTTAGALVGRDSEMALLRADKGGVRGARQLGADRGRAGHRQVLAGAGSGGGGAEAGCQVFWGAGDELGQALPLLPSWTGWGSRTVPNPRRSTIVRLLRGEMAADRGTDVPAALAEQLLALVTEQCAARPTILVVDDLQVGRPGQRHLVGTAGAVGAAGAAAADRDDAPGTPAG